MRSGLVLTAILLTFGSGCSMLSGVLGGPPAVIPTRPMQRVLPVPRLVAANDAIGSCLEFAPDGAFVLEACPPALAGMATNASEYKSEKGEHESGVLVVDAQQPPPGYTGPGGYWHVHEAHVTKVVTSQLGSGKLGALQLDTLDALCRDVRRTGDRVVVDRAYVGCAVIADGSGVAPATSALAMDQLHAQARRLGSPKDFRADGGDGPGASCEGEETAVLIGVVALSDVCSDFVRDLVLARAVKDASTAITDLEKAERELAAKQQAQSQFDARERSGRAKVQSLVIMHNELEAKVQALLRQHAEAEEKVREYRGDPYGLRSVDAKAVAEK